MVYFTNESNLKYHDSMIKLTHTNIYPQSTEGLLQDYPFSLMKSFSYKLDLNHS